MRTRRTAVAAAVLLALASSGCGDLARQSRAPVQLIINSLAAASGAEPDDLGATLRSDVLTVVDDVPTVFNDLGEVSISMILKDQGTFGGAAPSPLNRVTITRYRVVYRRTDGRNTPGVDVPFAFDSAVTFTVPESGSVTSGFQIVRHTAKAEAPLAALAFNPDVISTITEVTFYGQDQVGNDVSVSGTIGIDFGNFGDPD